MTSRSGNFTPWVGGAKGSSNLDKWGPAGLMNQVEWWIKTTSLKVREMETLFQKVSQQLSCSPNSVVEALKAKVLSIKDQKQILDVGCPSSP
jgi:hypothetical protein